MLKVTLKYLDNKTERVLNFFFKSTDLEGIVLSQSPADADFFVVDFDQKIDGDFWQQLQQNNQYAIVLCSKEQIEINAARTVKLLKPMKTANFSQSLQEISELIKKPVDVIEPVAQQITETAANQPEEALAETPAEEQSADVPEQADKQPIESERQSAVEIQVAAEKQHERPLADTADESANAVSTKMLFSKNIDFDWDLFLQTLHDHAEPSQKLDYPLNLRDPKQLRKLYFEPDRYLYHHLMMAIKMSKEEQTDVSIRAPFCSFYYHREENMFFRNFGDARFRAIQSSPVFKETKLSSTVLQTRGNRYGIDAQKLIWESAIFACEGRLPEQTNPYQQMSLLQEPGVSRLTAFSQDIHYGDGSEPKRKIKKDAISNSFKQAVKVIETLAKKRHSLIELEELHLAIPQPHLFTLYCAMQSINCIDVGGLAGDKEQKSLSAKIFSRLFS